MKAIDITGKQFGNWLVIEKAAIQKYGTDQIVWTCECQCGSKIRKDIGGCGLRRGESKGCGCNNKQRLRPYEALYRKMKSDNIRLRHLDFTLTYEEFLEFTKSNKCFYCYAEVYWKEHCVTGFGYNLDRMNNFQGYHKDNLVVCCSRCNMGKRDTFSFEEWYGMTEYFRRNL